MHAHNLPLSIHKIHIIHTSHASRHFSTTTSISHRDSCERALCKHCTLCALPLLRPRNLLSLYVSFSSPSLVLWRNIPARLLPWLAIQSETRKGRVLWSKTGGHARERKRERERVQRRAGAAYICTHLHKASGLFELFAINQATRCAFQMCRASCVRCALYICAEP